MKRGWPSWIRIALSVIVVMLVSWPLANYHWVAILVVPGNPSRGMDPTYVTGPVADITAGITQYTWRASFAGVEAVLAAAAAIGVFAALGRFVGAGKRESICRRCGQILRGLREPKCPACGEPL